MCASNTCKHVYILEGRISFYKQLHAMWVKTKWEKKGCVSHWPPLLQTLRQSLPLVALGRCLVQRVCYRISTRCGRGEMQMCHHSSGTSRREQSGCAGDGCSPSPELQHIAWSESKFCGSSQPQQGGTHPPTSSSASACWGWDRLDVDVHVWPSYHRAHLALGQQGETDTFGHSSSCFNAECLQ